jgi:cyclophilin family peptidyl-prolyl cis-trans isomerase
MPSDKRQRQDEGRLNRRIAEQAAAKKRNRNRATIRFGVAAVVVLGAFFVWSLIAKDDKDEVDTGSASSTTVETTAGDPAIGDTDCPPKSGAEERTTTFASGPKACIDVTKTYTAKVATSKGSFTVELDAKAAPKAVNSFVFLARNRYYDGVTFHRIIPGFVVQGGDATGDPPGTGGPGYTFADELPTGTAPFYAIGDLAMANSGADTNGSQFFVVTGEQGANLPAQYTRFGKVTEGMDVVQAIEKTGTAEGTPSETTTIESVEITEK